MERGEDAHETRRNSAPPKEFFVKGFLKRIAIGSWIILHCGPCARSCSCIDEVCSGLSHAGSLLWR